MNNKFPQSSDIKSNAGSASCGTTSPPSSKPLQELMTFFDPPPESDDSRKDGLIEIFIPNERSPENGSKTGYQPSDAPTSARDTPDNTIPSAERYIVTPVPDRLEQNTAYVSSSITVSMNPYSEPYKQESNVNNSHKVTDSELNNLLHRIANNSFLNNASSSAPQTHNHYTANRFGMSSVRPDSQDPTAKGYLPDRTVPASNSGTNNTTPYNNIENYEIKTKPQNTAEYANPSGEKAKHSDYPTAFEAAQAFMERYPVFTIKDSVYAFNGCIYESQEKLKTQQMIVKYCSDAVRAAGTSRYVDDIYKCLLQSDLPAKEKYILNSDIIVFENGVLSLENRYFYRHSPEFVTLTKVTCNYVPSALCPNFDAFLQQITDGDSCLSTRILEVIGYLLTTKDDAKVIVVFQGYSDTGKSILTNLISSMLNSSSVMHLDVNDLEGEYAIATLYEKSLCISADMPSHPLNTKVTSSLKKLTGFDTVSGNVKYKSYLTFQNYAKFILVTNHPLYTTSKDDALFRRMLAIPFVYQVPKDKQDKNLFKKLLAEKEGIAAKAVQAYYKLAANNFVFTGDYLLNQIFQNSVSPLQSCSLKDNVMHFVKHNITADSNACVYTEYAYQAFAQQYGEVNKNIFAQYFSSAISSLYDVTRKRTRKNSEPHATRNYQGIRLLEAPAEVYEESI